MFKDITFGQYFPGESVVHRLDARTKLILAAAYITIIFFVDTFIGYAVLAAFLLMAVAIAGISPKFLLKSLKPILFIVVLTFILNIFMVKGETILVEFWVISISWEGIRSALFLALRLVLLIMGTSVLTLTTSPLSLTDAMERLFKPLNAIRFPVHEMAMMMTIALRFIPILTEEADKIMKAQMARGADFESGNLIKRAKAMVPLLVPLFVSAFRRADELAMAMEARCYQGGKNRTRMNTTHMGTIDINSMLLMLAVCAYIVLEGWVL